MSFDAKPWVLGISCSHNGSVCLLRGDEIYVAIQEERLARRKRAQVFAAFPSLSIEYCLQYAGIEPSQLAAVGFSIANTFPNDVRNDIHLNQQLRIDYRSLKVVPVPHHLAHATAAYAISGFDRSAVLVVDGNGSLYSELGAAEQRAVLPSQRDKPGFDLDKAVETISIYDADRLALTPLEKQLAVWPSISSQAGMTPFYSFGTLYDSAGQQVFGQFLDGAGKLMGLAPFGQATIPPEEFFEIVDNEFVFHQNVLSRFPFSERWPARQKEYADLAASVQNALEIGIVNLVKRLRQLSPAVRLCYAGGVALNSVANERIFREGGFENVFIIPAAEDSGVSIGAAYQALWSLGGERATRALIHDSVGRRYSHSEIHSAIKGQKGLITEHSDNVVEDVVHFLQQGRIIGWFQGGSELGPRALGQRSILCDPRNADMKDRLNERVKFRESFRPYAPAIPQEYVADWFDVNSDDASPFMLRVMSFREGKRNLVPAVVHVDGTGRVQTLTREANGRLYELAVRLGETTGVPVVLNTSFNIAGQPIVETPEDAIATFLFSAIDVCVLGDCLLVKPPDFSILNYVFQLTADWISDEKPMINSSPNSDGSSPSALTNLVAASEPERRSFLPHDIGRRVRRQRVLITTTTRWGALEQAFEPDTLSLLNLIDGRRTGAEILQALNSAAEEWSRPKFASRMYRLTITGAVSPAKP